MKCGDCTWGVAGKPNAIIYKEMVCHRYPTLVNKMKADFCGEFAAKPVKKPVQKQKKTTKKKA